MGLVTSQVITVLCIYINKNKLPKWMYGHNIRSTTSNWIILFLCVRYCENKVCLLKRTGKDFLSVIVHYLWEAEAQGIVTKTSRKYFRKQNMAVRRSLAQLFNTIHREPITLKSTHKKISEKVCDLGKIGYIKTIYTISYTVYTHFVYFLR